MILKERPMMDEQTWLMLRTELDKNITDSMEIETNVGYAWKGDFYGLLSEKEIPVQFHFPHLLVNGLSSSQDYNGDIKIIKLIDLQYLNGIYTNLMGGYA